MLVLVRKKNQSIIIGEDIEIKVIDIEADRIKLGISAPKDLTILRKELYRDIAAENLRALLSSGDIDPDEAMRNLPKNDEK